MNTNNKVLLTTTKVLQLHKTNANYIALLYFCNNSIKSKISTSLSIVARQIYAILIALLFVISIVLLPWGAVYAAAIDSGSAVKWHPGHYYTLMSWGKDNPRYLSQVYNELKETPALRGVQIRYEWAELELAEGVYDFGAIEDRLAELAIQKKRLVILLQTRSFDVRSALVPNYLKTEKYEGGIFNLGSSSNNIRGNNIKLWNTLIHDRLVALVSALGQRFNSHPYFEGIGLTETAMGPPVVALSKDEEYGFYYNLLRINQQMRKHFPNTMTFQFANYPRPMLESFVNNLSAMGAGLGGPDVFLEDLGLSIEGPYTPSGIYNYYPKLSGIVPRTPSVMPANYINTKHDGSGYKPTVPALLAFARGKLKANYIFWTRDPDYYSEVLKVLNWRNQTSDPAGGLDSSCPTAYPSCVD